MSVRLFSHLGNVSAWFGFISELLFCCRYCNCKCHYSDGNMSHSPLAWFFLIGAAVFYSLGPD